MDKHRKHKMNPVAKSGYRMAEFAEAIGISRSGLYALPPELKPKSIKLRTSHIIIETPSSYLARIAEKQGAA